MHVHCKTSASYFAQPFNIYTSVSLKLVIPSNMPLDGFDPGTMQSWVSFCYLSAIETFLGFDF